MKLAEALAARADAQTRLQELRSRIRDNARHQEGEPPVEDPNSLILEADRVAAELTRLVRAINATNAATPLEGAGTLTDAIAERDGLALRRKVLAEAAAEANGGTGIRMLRSELRMVSALDVPELRRRIDELSRQRRQLDLRIQAADWTTEVLV
ncbi:MAG: DIP1984 family protein [Actinomycetota bacterium]|nr:DIP1984 family protein [Actinomycetota bacterium]